MRLIDADKLLEKVKELGGISCRDFCVDLKDIISAEEIDAVEVVRCKSCKHSQWSTKNKSFYCERRWAMHKVRERDFCSYGVRKDATKE